MREPSPHRPLSPDERRSRRQARRRRQVRRRRLAAVALACSIGVAAGGLALLASDGSPSAASAAQEAAKPVLQRTAATSVRQDRAARGSLGSGRAVTLAFGGDVHFESPIRERLASSPASVLDPIAPFLRRADLAVVNLETAVTDRGSPEGKQYVFRAPASAFAALRAGGVDVATVANNHGLDYGVAGLRDTLAASRHAHLPVIGAGMNAQQAYAPYRVTIKGQRVAIIGATQVLDDNLISAWTAGPGKPGLASAKDEERLLRAVRAARRTSDTLVVYLHWGAELVPCPTPVQRSLAAKLVRAGADVVVGSHAHVLLGAGRLGSALVDYGLGNFVFYAFREETSRSGVLEVSVTGRRINAYRWVPARIASGIPYPVRSGRSASVTAWRALRTCTGLRP